ncbi:hypothetical protein, partial [Burkholderia ubonensis]|uniref:hypothetical protein n=1 Tax=Burkholderia ubonensis TaxID=101571 RepID=UPI000A640E4E
LDGNRRFHPSESGSAMQSYFWDGTLASARRGVVFGAPSANHFQLAAAPSMTEPTCVTDA